MMLVTAAGLLADGPLPGLHTEPDGPGWVPARFAWLPVFAAAPAGCWAAFRRYERHARGGSRVVRRGRAARKEGVHGA